MFADPSCRRPRGRIFAKSAGAGAPWRHTHVAGSNSYAAAAASYGTRSGRASAAVVTRRAACLALLIPTQRTAVNMFLCPPHAFHRARAHSPGEGLDVGHRMVPPARAPVPPALQHAHLGRHDVIPGGYAAARGPPLEGAAHVLSRARNSTPKLLMDTGVRYLHGWPHELDGQAHGHHSRAPGVGTEARHELLQPRELGRRLR
jgi:hypothetical protein